MKLQPQLYIDTSGNPLGEPIYKRVEFFDFESIEVTSTIQDVRDIAKVFTDYSQTFSVPASKVNNQIFRHYYRTDVDNGFDARIKQRAEIHLNGILFRSGFVRLTKSTVVNGKPKSYRVTFFGGLTTLNNVLGNSELSELSSLDKYNHEYNRDNVYDGFRTGLQLSGSSVVSGTNRDVVYPSISASDKWYYNSSGSTAPEEFEQGTDSVNLYDFDEDGTYGINWLMLKPAIKVKHIIDAIEEKYSSLTFSDDFFGTADFDNLYMLLHSNKGVLAPKSSDITDVSVTYRVGTEGNTDFDLDTGSERRPMRTRFEYAGFAQTRVIQYHVIAEMSNTTLAGGGSGSPQYTLEVLDGDVVIDRFANVEGDGTYTSVLCTENFREWDNISIRVSSQSDQLSNFELGLELKEVRYKLPSVGQSNEYLCDVSNFNGVPDTASSLYSTSVAGVQSLLQTIEITKNMPKMKIMDFLSGLFKMFNLTAKVDEGGTIVVKTLNNFYEDGSTIDITTMVDTEEITVNRMDLFKNIEFEFSENKTFAIKRNNELAQTDYGNLEYQATADGTNSSLIFDGKDYKVKLPFEKIYYERLFDEDDLTQKTEMSNGWLADDNQKEVLTKPILFYNIPQTVDDGSFQIGFVGKGIISQYNRASNTNAEDYFDGNGWQLVDGTKSLNFNTEYDEYTFSEVKNSLFRRYYSNYITTVFDKNTRIFELEMKASLSFLLNYKINDTLIIKGEQFLINNIRTNLTTGVTKLELILKFFIEGIVDLTGDPITTPTGLSLLQATNSSLTVNWNANPTGEIAKGYKIYVDSVLEATLLRQTSHTIQNLTANTSYDVQISAYDAQGNESALSSALSLSTLSSDTQAPTSPTNLVASNISAFGADLSWTASTDNIGVTAYDVYVDGSVSQTVTSNSAILLGLTSNTVYEVNVKAKDASGNESGFSNTIQFRTL